jgi:membrane-bound lytic murein transglycosylase MltF
MFFGLLKKRAATLLAFFYLGCVQLTHAEISVVLPNDDVMLYCGDNGCDNQLFYRYYEKNAPRLCRESSSLFKNRTQSTIFSYILTQAQDSDIQNTVSVIPILESSLNPSASAGNYPSAAKGLWQMKPGTAKDMGLIINTHVDQRYDIIHSTRAGISYVAWLESKFDDHNLAVLAYHIGYGRLSKLIKKYNTKNPWFLSQLISEKHPDKDYLLKYYGYSLALMNKGCNNENS